MCWPRFNSQKRSIDPPQPIARSFVTPPPPPTPPVLYHNNTNPAALSAPSLVPVFDGPPCHPASLPSALLPPSKLLSLPSELLLDIASFLPISAIYHLHLCNRRLHSLLLHRLTNAFPQHADHVATWSLYRNSPTHLTRALDAGATFRPQHLTLAITLRHAGLLSALFAARPQYPVNTLPLEDLPPLHHAATQKAAECMGVLLRAGAEVDLRDRQGNTALYYALRGGYKEIAKLLTTAGAGRAVKWLGGDAMLYAIMERPGMVGILAEAGWVNSPTKGERRVSVIEDMLLDAGWARGGRGPEATPLQMAVRVGRLEVLRLLLEAGAAVDELGDGPGSGWAPLHECVLHQGRENMIELLIQKGARLGVLGGAVRTGVSSRHNRYQEWYGVDAVTPLELAARMENYAAERKLMSYEVEG